MKAVCLKIISMLEDKESYPPFTNPAEIELFAKVGMRALNYDNLIAC